MAHIAYISFDRVPAPKGAATHIAAFARGLAAEFGGVDLVTVSASVQEEAPIERWPGVMHWELPAAGVSLIERVLCFRSFLTRWLGGRGYRVIHFRSIFEGLPVLRHRNGAALVFEVNGLPSIELKYRYPGSEDDRELMRKIEAQERACIAAADRIVTPSAITGDFLIRARGAVRGKIAVIPNGVDTEVFRPSGTGLSAPSGHGSRASNRVAAASRDHSERWKLLYFGTLSPWQGIELAIRAVAKVDGARLTVVGAGSRMRGKTLDRLATKLGIADRVELRPAVSQEELAQALRECDAVLAPLMWNDRNVVQGCCPLKILEGMASGRPVIASDLDVARELGLNEEHFLLFETGSADSMAKAIVRLRDDPALAEKLASNGRRWVENRYTWAHAVKSLIAVYPISADKTL